MVYNDLLIKNPSSQMIWGVGAVLLGLSCVAYTIFIRLKRVNMDFWDKVNLLRLLIGGLGFLLVGILILTGWF